MKPTEPSENPEPVRRLLAGWKVSAPLPPRFQEAVWRRIEQLDAQPDLPPWWDLLARLVGALPRPAVAATYVLALLVLGGVTGYWQARMESARIDGSLSLRYVQSVDPYQSPRQ